MSYTKIESTTLQQKINNNEIIETKWNVQKHKSMLLSLYNINKKHHKYLNANYIEIDYNQNYFVKSCESKFRITIHILNDDYYLIKISFHDKTKKCLTESVYKTSNKDLSLIIGKFDICKTFYIEDEYYLCDQLDQVNQLIKDIPILYNKYI